MALTFTPVENPDVLGSKKARVCVAEIAQYTNGGEPVVDAHALALGLRKIERVEILEGSSDNGNVWAYDEAAKKVVCYQGNYDAADGPLQPVGSGTDCGEVLVRVIGF